VPVGSLKTLIRNLNSASPDMDKLTTWNFTSDGNGLYVLSDEEGKGIT
jgi:hypothetical protein